MQRVTRSTAVASLPAAPSSPGTPGFFTGGNPAGGIPATTPGYEWFNAVQEELLAPILAAGLTPNGAVLTQLRDALQLLHGGGGSLGSANGASGWQRLAGGLIMQWGKGTTPQAAAALTNASVAITLPTPFPSFVLGGPQVTLTDGGITGTSWSGTTLFAEANLTTITVTGVTSDYAPTRGFGFAWQVLGR